VDVDTSVDPRTHFSLAGVPVGVPGQRANNVVQTGVKEYLQNCTVPQRGEHMVYKESLCGIARFVLFSSAFLLTANVAIANPITLGTWYEFGFDPGHSSAAAGCLPVDPAGVPCRPPDPGVVSVLLGAPPWTFSSPSAVVLTITDVFLAGDNFQVFDNGTLIGSTNVPLQFLSCGINPDVCLTNPNFAHGSFLMSSGAHSITIGVMPAQILGEGFFRVDAVPEPSTLSLLALGLGCFIATTVRRRF